MTVIGHGRSKRWLDAISNPLDPRMHPSPELRAALLTLAGPPV